MNDIAEIVRPIYGFLDDEEARLLYRLACEVPRGGNIVEIGSFQGKSTVCLGLGAKERGANVYAIDPHDDYMVDERTHYGMENHAALLKNLTDFNLGATVRVIAIAGNSAVMAWIDRVDLLWIDGNHSTAAVRDDAQNWSMFVRKSGKIVFHDFTNPRWPGVSDVVSELVRFKIWRVTEQVGSIAVIERVQ